MAISNDLTKVNKKISSAEGALKEVNNPNTYVDLLKNVLNDSYRANADIIAYRRAAREKLYSPTPIYQPENYGMLSPAQQESIRNAPRAGLVAGIQAANETEAARGTRVENLAQSAYAPYADTRASLVDSLNKLYSERSDIKGRIKTMEKDGYVIGFDSETGKQLYKLDTGVRDYHAGSGGKSWGDLSVAEKLDALGTKGYGVTPQSRATIIADRVKQATNTSGGFSSMNDKGNLTSRIAAQVDKEIAEGKITFGVDFNTPQGKVAREDWTRITGVNWQDAAKEQGSVNPDDMPGTISADRLGKTLSEQEKITIRKNVASAIKAGSEPAVIIQYIIAQGGDPADFGYKDWATQ